MLAQVSKVLAQVSKVLAQVCFFLRVLRRESTSQSLQWRRSVARNRTCTIREPTCATTTFRARNQPSGSSTSTQCTLRTFVCLVRACYVSSPIGLGGYFLAHILCEPRFIWHFRWYVSTENAFRWCFRDHMLCVQVRGQPLSFTTYFCH